MTSAHQDIIANIVAAIQSQDGDAINESLWQLEGQDPQAVIAELFIAVDKAVGPHSVTDLVEAATLPLPPHAEEVTYAALALNLRAVQNYLSADYAEILGAMLSLVAALDHAADRL